MGTNPTFFFENNYFLSYFKIEETLKTSTRLAGPGIWTRDLPNASLVRYHGVTSLGINWLLDAPKEVYTLKSFGKQLSVTLKCLEVVSFAVRVNYMARVCSAESCWDPCNKPYMVELQWNWASLEIFRYFEKERQIRMFTCMLTYRKMLCGTGNQFSHGTQVHMCGWRSLWPLAMTSPQH